VQPHRVIGVDVGGTKTLYAVVTHEGAIEARLERHTVVSSQDALLAELDDGVEELRTAHPDTSALGFGIPSRVDQRTGRAVASVNVPLTDVDFRDRMRERHGLPVEIDNDGNAAAIAEWRIGAARGASNVVMLTLGTGIGGGLILGGRPYRGATGSGAELGHIVIEYDGFEYHYKKGAPVGVGNHERYLNEADVERQLTLESYGYRFLRLNRFNLGTDPIVTLSERLEQIAASAIKSDPTGAVKVISEQAGALTDKSAKVCERCGSIKPLALFFDKMLGDGAGGTGRVCMPCKQADRSGMRLGRRHRRRRWK